MFLGLSLVSLPPEVKALIFAVVAFIIGWIINQVALLWPWLASYLGPYKDQVVTALATAVIAWIETQLNLFPQYENVINVALQLLVAILAVVVLPFVTFKHLQRQGHKSFR